MGRTFVTGKAARRSAVLTMTGGEHGAKPSNLLSSRGILIGRIYGAIERAYHKVAFVDFYAI